MHLLRMIAILASGLDRSTGVKFITINRTHIGRRSMSFEKRLQPLILPVK